METWLDDVQLKSEGMREYGTLRQQGGREARVAVIPDAYFILNLGTRRAHLFLELDRATMALARWKVRVAAYEAFVRSGKYWERYKSKSLRILTVTTSRTRMKNLKELTQKTGARGLFWFSTLEQISQQTILTAPIWSVAGESEPHPLIS